MMERVPAVFIVDIKKITRKREKQERSIAAKAAPTTHARTIPCSPNPMLAQSHTRPISCPPNRQNLALYTYNFFCCERSQKADASCAYTPEAPTTSSRAGLAVNTSWLLRCPGGIICIGGLLTAELKFDHDRNVKRRAKSECNADAISVVASYISLLLPLGRVLFIPFRGHYCQGLNLELFWSYVCFVVSSWLISLFMYALVANWWVSLWDSGLSVYFFF